MSDSREWGDGATDARDHVINVISYEDDFIKCRCGETIFGIGDGAAWRLHGGSVFVGRGFEERSTATLTATDDTLADLVDSVHWFMSNCTCDSTPIEDCPNYVEGDEEGTDDD